MTLDLSEIVASLDRLANNQTMHPSRAWIAATGKPELSIRDEMGSDIAAHHPNLVVAREWRRHDLAVLGLHGGCLAVIEGTALYDFDLLRGPQSREYRQKLSKDSKKLRSTKPVLPLLLILMTSVRTEVPAELNGVVKYSGYINSHLRKDGSELKSRGHAAVLKLIAEVGTLQHSVQLTSREVMGLQLSLQALLVSIG